MLVSAFAQQGPSGEIPLSPRVIKGKLDNGLTYYVYHNKTATDRAEFYLVNNVGAVLENEDQNGLAHFCEHMAFNGTKHFPDKGILEFMERNGVKFGHNVNAFTSHDITAYMLSGVPVDKSGLVDSSLLVIKDWAANVSYDHEEIDKERGVIHEEWRTRRSADFRMRDVHQQVIWEGSRYAERNIIGKLDIIDNCEYETLKSFYRDWYRPDLQAVIVVGDVDAKEMETKIIEMFSDIPVKENPRERPEFVVPDHDDIKISVATDKEASRVTWQFYYKHDATRPADKDMAYYYNQIQYNLITTMMINRFSELRQSDNPPFIYGYAFYASPVRTKDAFMGIIAANPSEPVKGFEAFLEEGQRMKQHGFTEGEMERAKTDLMRHFEKNLKEKDKRENRAIVRMFMGNFLTNDPAAGPEFEHEMAKKYLPGISLDDVNKLAATFITDKNMVVTVSAPEDVELPSEEQLLAKIKEYSKLKTSTYEDDALDIPLMAKIPEAAAIKEESENKELGFYEWKFENGARFVVKPTEFKEDEVSIYAVSRGGASLYSIEDKLNAQYAASLVSASGLGEFSATQLHKKLNGKVIRISPYVSTYYEGFYGSTSPDDLEEAMQMINLYFTSLHKDENAFNSFAKRQRASLERKYSNPRAVARDTFMNAFYNYHPFYEPMTMEKLDEINYERSMDLFRERFAGAGDFTFVMVGNIDVEALKKMTAVYIGSLPTSEKEKFRDLGVKHPEGYLKKHYNYKMEIPKSTVSVAYHGDAEFSLANEIKMEILTHVLDLKYTEIIREDMGGTYGVHIGGSIDREPQQYYRMMVNFDCDPERVNEFIDVIHEQVNSVAENGPDETAVDKARQHLLKKHTEELEKNYKWTYMLKDYALYGEAPVINEKYNEIVNSITTKDIQNLAASMKKQNVVESVMNPEK